jgi:hypothetical protein
MNSASGSGVARNPLAFAIALAFAAGGAKAATITVTDGGDAGTSSTCTLRQAIVSANNDAAGSSTCAAGNGADIISFTGTLQNSTITLQQGQLNVSSPMTINGGGVTVDGNQTSRLMAVYYNASTLTDVTLSSLTLTNGSAGNNPGGGICATTQSCNLQAATPTVQRGAVREAPQAAYGVQLTLDDVKVSNNTASYRTGGIFLDRHVSLSMNDSTVSGNSINAATEWGSGGIYLSEDSYLSMTNSTVSGNSASGDQRYLTGGIYAYASYGVHITNSTVSGNSATCNEHCAGALSISGGNPPASAQLYDSTVSGNSAVSTGGNTNDVGGAMVGADYYATVTLANTILAGNSGDHADLDVPSGLASASASLLGSSLSSTYSGNGNLFNDNPVLGPLANNGGPTQTMALLNGSPAIDAGNNSLIPGLDFDQRGAGFPRIINITVDIGAYEAQAAAPAPAPRPAPTLSAWAITLLGSLLAVLGVARERKRKTS